MNFIHERKKLRIAFDVDDVLNYFTEAICERCAQVFGHEFPFDEVVWGFENYKPEETEYVHELFKNEEFINSLHLKEGMDEMLYEVAVNRGHDVVFVTSTYSAVMTSRALLLCEAVPFIHPRNYIMTGRKDLVHTDLQFDDCLSHIIHSNSEIPTIVTKPWNKNAVGYVRCNSDPAEYLKIVDMAEQGYSKQDIYKELNPVCETHNPHIIVVVGGSGIGKSTIIQKIIELSDDYEIVVTNTTRKPREGEVNAKDYFFRSREEFEKMIADNKMLEYTTYAGNYYGTSKDVIDNILAKGKNAIVIMDVDGVNHIKEAYPDKSYSVQIVRKKEALIESIMRRNIPDEEKIRRIAQLEGESYDAARACNYRILNNTVEDAAKEIINIFKG